MARRAILLDDGSGAWSRLIRDAGWRLLVAARLEECEGAPADVLVLGAGFSERAVRQAWLAQGRGEPVLVGGEGLIAAMEAAVSRGPGGRLALGPWLVDLDRLTATRAGETVALTGIEAGLLATLASADAPFSRETLLREVWGHQVQVITRAVDNAIVRLREKLEEDPAVPRWIVTVRGQGYRLEGGARAADVAPAIPGAPIPPGREGVIAEVLAAFSGGARMVVLHGPPGLGLNGISAAIAASAAIRADGGLEASAIDPGRLGGSPVRIDGVRPEDVGVLESWLALPRFRAVVTTRRPLATRQAVHVAVGPLAVEIAAQILRERAEATGEPIDGDLAAAIARAVAGWPAAIDEMVARLRIVGPEGVAASLGRPHEILPRISGLLRADLAAGGDGYPDDADARAFLGPLRAG